MHLPDLMTSNSMFRAMLTLKNLENQKFTVTLEGKER